jgi:hypothetical protein
MPRNRIDLSYLRRRQADIGDGPIPSPVGAALTRRQLFGVAGAAAVGVSPVLQAGHTAWLGPFSLALSPGRAAFTLGGRECWVVDIRQFAGAPSLTAEQDENTIRLVLTGARYPGTMASADLNCLLKRGPTGWRMTLTMPVSGLRGRAQFERWLVGAETMSVKGTFPRLLACALGEGSDLTLGGRTEVTYRPDGSLRLSGDRAALLRHGGVEFPADACEITPVAADVPSLRHGAPRLRTTLRLQRGGPVWPSAPLLPPAPAGMLSGDDVFDTLEVEATESRRGVPRHTLSASVSTPGAGLTFHLCSGAGLPLHTPRTAVAFDAAGQHDTALVADHAPHPSWVRLAGVDVQIGHPGGGECFTMTGRGARLTGLDCAPALLAAAVPMSGAAVEPVRFQDTPRLRVALDGVGPSLPGRTAAREATVQVGGAGAGPLQLPPGMSVSVLRPDDLLALRFEFINLGFDADRTYLVGGPSSTEAAYIVVYFPPQSVAEQVFPEDSAPGTTLAQAAAAGESRLAFIVAPALLPLPYTLPSLLSTISQSAMSLVPNATAPGILPFGLVGPIEPFPDDLPPSDPDTSDTPVTAIEMPWRLVVSPTGPFGGPFQVWEHAAEGPVTHGGRTELWHTRLAISGPAGPDESDPRFARAVWSPDYTPNGIYDPFTTALTSNDRRQLVDLMADFSGSYIGNGEYISNFAEFQYMTVDRMMLSALGGWLDSRYDGSSSFTNSDGNNVTGWDHHAAMGRDSYVRVVYAGTLFPLGHSASLIKVTERRLARDSNTSEYQAYLFQRTYIVVRQPVKTYTDVRMPFRTVQITTLTTPDLAPPETSGSQVGSYGAAAFWPVGLSTGADVRFHVVATDFEGQQAEFTLPLIFLATNGPSAEAITLSTENGYNTAVDSNTNVRRSVSMGGQSVAFAPTDGTATGHGATTFPTGIVALAATLGDGQSYLGDGEIYGPVFGGATIRLPAVEQIAGAAMGAINGVAVQFHQLYAEAGGFGGSNNVGQVFLQLIGDPLKALPDLPYDPTNLAPSLLNFAADKSGGLATPDMSITGLSRALGPVAGNLDPSNAVNSILGGHFDPTQYFNLLDSAKLLGAIPLSDLLSAVNDLTQTPQILSQKLPDSLVATLTWTTSALQSLPLFSPNALGMTSELVLTATVTQQIPKATGPSVPALPTPSYDVMGKLNDFTLDMFGFIGLTFNAVTFHAASGQKLTVSPDIDSVDFEGPLTFVDQLRELIPTGGFDPAGLDISPTGVTASLALTIPSGGIGVFSLENIRFTSSLTIPFTGDPVRLRIGFSSREDPFLVTVSLISGGGYFTLALGADGVETLEAGIDLGGNISVDLGILSANVHVLFGLSFVWDNVKNAATVSGYYNIGGSVEVLGLITVTIQFFISLSYTTDGTIAGEASLTIEIDILFFSKSVTLSVHREFHNDHLSLSGLSTARLLAAPRSGASGPPRFVDVVPTQADWNAYAAAFAA